MFKDNRGSGLLIVLIFAALAIGVVGYVSYITWQANQDSKANQQPNNAQTPVNTNKKKVSTLVIPKDYTKYESEDLGFSFAYPKAWGEVSAGETSGGPYIEGKAYYFNFDKNSKMGTDISSASAVIQTKDYKKLGTGSGYSYRGPGFTDYDEAVSQAKNGGTVIEEKDNHFVYANLDCVDLGYYIVAMARFADSEFPGIAIGYYKDLQGTGVCDTDNKPLSDFLEKEVQAQLINIAKSVNQTN